MQELYKKHRPKKLERMVGNEATIKSIKSKVESGTLPHFILLSGPSGCGKTTIARIVKEMIECGDQDFIEINAANQNGVELAREIERKFKYRSISGSVRIWLIDEAHNLTKSCMESLLKPLEDTPEHVYFIFATTEPEKIKGTIKTRATEYKVSPLKDEQVEKLVKRVCKKEKMELPEEVIEGVIDNAGGSARMALVLLDKVRGLDEEEMLEVVQQSKKQESDVFELLQVLMGWNKGGWSSCMKVLNNLDQDAEGVRRYILSAASNQLLKPNKGKNHKVAHHILCCFEKDFFTTGKAGLILACYESLLSE